MGERGICQVESCNDVVHARGYCRRHYGRYWRRGRLGTNAGRTPQDNDRNGSDSGEVVAVGAVSESQERLRTLERELRKAEQLYAAVVGFRGRIKWRREMEAVKAEILKLDDSYFSRGRL
jgi:hypothetical protein